MILTRNMAKSTADFLSSSLYPHEAFRIVGHYEYNNWKNWNFNVHWISPNCPDFS